MTVRDLIDALSEQDPDTPVRIAYQPSYPLRGQIACVTDYVDADIDAVWIAVVPAPHDENPYAPRDAWSGC